MSRIKPCPICGIGKPHMVHYAIPLKVNPDCWEETEDCLFEPMVTYKYIECSNCGARATGLEIRVDDAVNVWNEEDDNGNRTFVVQYIADEELEVVE